MFRITRHSRSVPCSPDPQSYCCVGFSIVHQCILLFIRQVVWKNIWNEYAICCSVERRDSSMLIIVWCGNFVYMKADCNALLNKNHCNSVMSALAPTTWIINSGSYIKDCITNVLPLDLLCLKKKWSGAVLHDLGYKLFLPHSKQRNTGLVNCPSIQICSSG